MLVEHIERCQPKGEKTTKRRVDLARPRTPRAYRYNLPLGMEDDEGLIPLSETQGASQGGLLRASPATTPTATVTPTLQWVHPTQHPSTLQQQSVTPTSSIRSAGYTGTSKMVTSENRRDGPSDLLREWVENHDGSLREREEVWECECEFWYASTSSPFWRIQVRYSLLVSFVFVSSFGRSCGLTCVLCRSSCLLISRPMSTHLVIRSYPPPSYSQFASA